MIADGTAYSQVVSRGKGVWYYVTLADSRRAFLI